MKEAFVNVDTLIDQTKLLGDMELQAYLTSLSDSQKNEFISSNVGETIRAVDASKAARFNDLRAICSPAVAFATATAYLAPQYSAAYLSKSKVFCPCVKELNPNCFTTS